jgi:hypothetical protein
MRKLLLILFIPFVMTACAKGPHATVETCPVDGSKQVMVHYGDSQIKVTPANVEIHQGKMLKFNLNGEKSGGDPVGVNYEDVAVTIKGKTTEGKSWLWVVGSESVTGTLSVCAPEGADRTVEYSYIVEVDKVGVLDPRATVEP